jgi:hypothetical protein
MTMQRLIGVQNIMQAISDPRFPALLKFFERLKKTELVLVVAFLLNNCRGGVDATSRK